MLDQILLLASSVGNGTEVKVCKQESKIVVSVKGNASEFPVKYRFDCDLRDTETVSITILYLPLTIILCVIYFSILKKLPYL